MNKQKQKQPTKGQISQCIGLLCEYYGSPDFEFEQHVKQTYTFEQFQELRQILREQSINIGDIKWK